MSPTFFFFILYLKANFMGYFQVFFKPYLLNRDRIFIFILKYIFFIKTAVKIGVRFIEVLFHNKCVYLQHFILYEK